MKTIFENKRQLKVCITIMLAGLAWSSPASADPIIIPIYLGDPFRLGIGYIVACLVIEYPFVRWIGRFSIRKSILAVIVMNLVSTLPGFFFPLIAIEEIVHSWIESPFDQAVAIKLFWVLFSLILLVIIDTFIEMKVLKLIFKHKPQLDDYWILGMANFITVSIGYLIFLGEQVMRTTSY